MKIQLFSKNAIYIKSGMPTVDIKSITTLQFISKIQLIEQHEYTIAIRGINLICTERHIRCVKKKKKKKKKK